jgi:hypothetical protein
MDNMKRKKRVIFEGGNYKIIIALYPITIILKGSIVKNIRRLDNSIISLTKFLESVKKVMNAFLKKKKSDECCSDLQIGALDFVTIMEERYEKKS